VRDEDNIPTVFPTAVEVAQNEITGTRAHLDSSVEAIRAIERVDPIERRRLNGAIDDCAADLTRLQTAMQRLMERTQGEPDGDAPTHLQPG